MRKIILRPDVPFYNSCDVAIIDITEGSEKKRGKLTLEYGKVDVQQFIDRGMDLPQAMEYYRTAVDANVRHYISGDWTCEEGLDTVMEIVEEHIRPYFD